jgi:hypothetical protein
MADFEVKIATDAREIEQAQRLRFNVFNLELHKGLASSYEHGLDIGGAKKTGRGLLQSRPRPSQRERFIS